MTSLSLSAPPTVGTPTTLTLTDAEGAAGVGLPGIVVQATIAPGTPWAHRVSVGTTDTTGKVTWTPEAPGLARIETARLSQTFWVGSPGGGIGGLIPGAAAVLLVLLWRVARRQTPNPHTSLRSR